MQISKSKKKYLKITKLSLYIFVIITVFLIPLSETKIKDMETYVGKTQFDGNYAYKLDKELSYKFQKRVVGTKNDYEISNWTAKKFKSYGLKVTWQNFTTKNFDGKKVKAMNVIAIKEGRSKKSIVIMAHHDIVPTTFQGANDNGAGTAVMLELAKNFAKLENKYTLIFVSVDAEETGLHGSKYFVKNYEKIENVFVAVVIDMCSWRNATAIEIYGCSTFDGKFSDAWPICLAYNVGNKNKINVHFSKKAQFINRLTLMNGTTDSTSFVECGIPAIGIGDSDLANHKNSYPWVHSWRDTINETSIKRFQYVGNFTEKYIKSLMMIKGGEEQGKIYFFTDKGYIPPYIFYLHFSSYLLLFAFILIESIRKIKIKSNEQNLFTFFNSLFILIIPLFSLTTIYFISKFEGFETSIGKVNWKTYIILIALVEFLSMIYIFYGGKISKKLTKNFLKVTGKNNKYSNKFKESNEVIYSFTVFLIFIFFAIGLFKNAFITILFFGLICLVFPSSKPRKKLVSKIINIASIFFAFFLPLIILSKLVSKCEINNFYRYIPSIISSAYGSSAFIIISFFVAFFVLNIKLILSNC